MFIVSYANCYKHRSDNTSFRLTLKRTFTGLSSNQICRAVAGGLVSWAVGRLVRRGLKAVQGRKGAQARRPTM